MMMKDKNKAFVDQSHLPCEQRSWANYQRSSMPEEFWRWTDADREAEAERWRTGTQDWLDELTNLSKRARARDLAKAGREDELTIR